jgi:hypothetical protein
MSLAGTSAASIEQKFGRALASFVHAIAFNGRTALVPSGRASLTGDLVTKRVIHQLVVRCIVVWSSPIDDGHADTAHLALLT